MEADFLTVFILSILLVLIVYILKIYFKREKLAFIIVIIAILQGLSIILLSNNVPKINGLIIFILFSSILFLDATFKHFLTQIKLGN